MAETINLDYPFILKNLKYLHMINFYKFCDPYINAKINICECIRSGVKQMNTTSKMQILIPMTFLRLKKQNFIAEKYNGFTVC